MAPIREVGLEPAGAAANLSVGKISPAGNRAGLLAAAALPNFLASLVLRCAPAAARGDGGAVAVSEPETSPGRSRRTTTLRVLNVPVRTPSSSWVKVPRVIANLKIGSPDFGPTWVRCRLVKLEKPAEDGATHIALWEPRD